MDSKPRAFIVLESAPTSEEEFSACIVADLPARTLRPPVFSAVRAEFSPEEEAKVNEGSKETESPRPKCKKAKCLPLESPLTNIEALKQQLDSLETRFSLDSISEVITCRLCDGFMRHPVCLLECTHTCRNQAVCKVCALTQIVEQGKCPLCRTEVSGYV